MVEGDLLDQPVEVIVNAWNRNIIPCWLLLPLGVSGAIKRREGTGPFKELAKHDDMPLGSAVLTSAGPLPYKRIIHVAGIRLLWRAKELSIRSSIKNALAIVSELRFGTVAFPLIGTGAGGFRQNQAQALILETLEHCDGPTLARVVCFDETHISSCKAH